MNKLLAKIVRRILAMFDIDEKKYQQLTEEYIKEQELPLAMQQAALRNQLKKAFDPSQSKMTVDTALKIAKMLKINKIAISVTVQTKDGTEHKSGYIHLDN